jgi:hypothetical protein
VKQPWPNRLTNRPHRRCIQCEDRLTPYPDTRASVGRAKVTAVTSPPLLLSDLTGKQRRSPHSDCRANHPGEAYNKSRSTTEFSLGRNRKLRLARPQAPALGGGLRLTRPQAPASEGSLCLARPLDSASTSVSGGIASSLDPGLGLKRSLRLARPWARADRANRGYIITLSLASSSYNEQDRRPIWLTPVTGNDGTPRATMTLVALSPLRQQGDVSRILAALPAVLLQGSGASPMATLSRIQGSSSPPIATLACT